eukprot:2992000-Rhodomonas_salina.3
MLRSLLLCVGVAAVGAFSPQVLLTRPVGVLPESRICSHQKFGRSGALRLVSQTSPTEVAEIKQAEKKRIPDFDVEIPAPKEGDYLDQFCRGTNNLMKQVASSCHAEQLPFPCRGLTHVLPLPVGASKRTRARGATESWLGASYRDAPSLRNV